MPRKHPEYIKEAVLKLGKREVTYSEIQKLYSVPKSTLSYWFKNDGEVRDRSKQLEHLKRAREKATETIRANRKERLLLATSIAKSVLDEIPLENKEILKSLLAMLYWAEGTKSDRSSGINFVNTDPVLLKLYISLLRSCYDIDEDRLRAGLHIHNYHNAVEAVHFWSEALKIPESQFWKIYVKKRSSQKKFRENFQGMCTVYYGDARIRRELLTLGRLIAEKHNTLSSFNG